MRKDFVGYIPYIIVSLLVVTSIVIYERGGFERDQKSKSTVAIPQITVNPSASPVTSPSPTDNPILIIESPAPTYTNMPKPSIRGFFGGEFGGEDD